MKFDKRWVLQTIWVTVLILLVNSVRGDDEGHRCTLFPWKTNASRRTGPEP